MRISKAKAFIGIAQEMRNGNEKKANIMLNIVGKAIAADNRKKQIDKDIVLKREEKVYFQNNE